MPRTHHATARRRRSIAVLACLGLALVAAVVQPDPARAVATNPFVINGTGIPDAGAVQLDDPFGNVKELGPKNASTTKIGVIHKAASPMLDRTNPNAQVDLRRAWLDLERDSGNNDWVYFAWERDSNSGSGFIAFEFMANGIPSGCSDYATTEAQLIAGCNPWKDRQAGDFLVLWDQSGSSTSLYKRVWQQSGSGLVLGTAQAISNGVAAFSPDHFKGEAAVNITAEGLSDPGECVSFANVIPSTVTGNSDTADYKDTILQRLDPISNCEADLVTTPKDGAGNPIPGGGLSIGTGVVAVKDSATLSLSGGASTPTGAISFELCKVGDASSCTDVGSTSVAGGSYPRTVLSPVAYVTAAGDYCWSTSWPGDLSNGIPAASDSSAGECFTVNPVDPSLATTAGPDVVLGNGVSDTATLSGTATQPADPVINTTGAAGAPAGGTITFTLHGPSGSGCGSLVHTTAPVTVSGDGTYDTPDPQFEPGDVGVYHWVAEYSGSPNTNGTDHNTACEDTDEDVTVEDVPSSLTTTQSWVPNDAATLSADEGGDLAGTVTFELFDNATCSGSPLWSEDVAVDGPSGLTVGTSNAEAVDASGDFSWRVAYDSDNPAQRDIPSSCEEVSSLTIDNGTLQTSP
ncbi:MAG TPA: hypothetical protein VNS46_10320 [Nocardioides sp.]|nr:hypothetical protein [Nocardioides sp.]